MLLAQKQAVGNLWGMAPPKPRADIRDLFARRLKVARLRKYSRAAQFAREIGIEEETYRRWERGETEPGLADLNTILQKLDVSADHLVTGDLPPKPRRPGPR